MSSRDSLEEYMAETLGVTVKTADELVDESLSFSNMSSGQRGVIGFPYARVSRIWPGVVAIAACIGIGFFAVPRIFTEPNFVEVSVAQIYLPGEARSSDVLMEFVEGRQENLQAVYLEETKYLKKRFRWRAEYEISMHADSRLDVQVVVRSLEPDGLFSRIRKTYNNEYSFKKELISLENDILAIVLDDTQNIEP